MFSIVWRVPNPSPEKVIDVDLVSGKWKVESGEANCGDLIGVPNALSRLLDQLYLFIFYKLFIPNLC